MRVCALIFEGVRGLKKSRAQNRPQSFQSKLFPPVYPLRRKETPARMLSLGQRMRCEIAAALLHGPEFLFLDEPTIGLDAVSKLKVREFILEQNKLCGTTVLLTTHDMQDIDALCSRVLLIGKGQLLLDGDTAQIRAMAGENLSTEESVADLYRRFGI